MGDFRQRIEPLMSFWLRHYYQWRYPNLTIEPGVRIAGKIKLSGSVRVRIAAGTRLRKHSHFFGEGVVNIGRDCLINGCSVGCYRRIDVGDECLIADCYMIDSDFHNSEPHLRHAPLLAKNIRPIRIERNVWLASGSRVLKGVTIGENSVVGLGAVIRRPVPANVVVIGNPEQIVKRFTPAERERAIEELHA
ncbi:acyltransferase [Gloeobacter kilaueensis]|uniref:Galactoside O-acetyltransferase n=1 Tax=Gloeobacter kilaueensis (strain ATCC BAA-2537 / CCAP 1431/1 / ULC 316 / JS1) TaxID=1183438 RepID=U5QCQ3_GLOK1|nr:acyltransferase [Gloeobacter kilaueensis]AGY56702.1 galactoside O-acetyltransferase [Gloeobacter kilaueensis JS1]